MKTPAKGTIRFLASLTVLVCLLVLINSATAPASPSTDSAPEGQFTGATSTQPVIEVNQQPDRTTGESTDGPGDLTVVTTQGFYTGVAPGDRQTATLQVFNRRGEQVYESTRYNAYFDVDPVGGTRSTVEYVAAERTGTEGCDYEQCSYNFVERLNISTGERTRIYGEYTPQYDTGRWHDVDRINDTHLVVADIVFDRIYIVDTSTDEITWQWNVTRQYEITAGGSRADWAHVNDVEVLNDGRIMASLRNMDSIVFLDPGHGIDTDWTLGRDDEHDILYEQHNPDYIPPERGGPAIIVSDSENNRVLEYRRVDGEWQETWSWRDAQLQWPRDADRLPNGNTLITDSHGDRIIEVSTNGSIVWEVEVEFAYDAERLSTGPESAGGYAAGTSFDAENESGQSIDAPPASHQGSRDNNVIIYLKSVLPSKPVNGLLYVSPGWIEFSDLLAIGTLLVTMLAWAIVEWHWSSRSMTDALIN